MTFLRRRDRDGPRAAYIHAQAELRPLARGIRHPQRRIEVGELGQPRTATHGGAALGEAGPLPDARAHRGHVALGDAGDRRPAGTRALYTLASGLLHIGLSYWFNYRWTNTPPTALMAGRSAF